MAVTRIFDIIPQLLEKYNKPNALAAKVNGKWVEYSTQEFADTVNYLSYGLLQLGIEREEKIGIISNNRPEWIFADDGCSNVAPYAVIVIRGIGGIK